MSLRSQISFPQNPLLRSYIDLYRLIDFPKGVEGATIANGRLDMTILLKGKFEVERDGDYHELPNLLVFPLMREGGNNYRVSSGSLMINIKLYPHVLTRPVLQRMEKDQLLSWSVLFGEEPTQELLEILRSSIRTDDWKIHLDAFFEKQLFSGNASEETLVTETISYIENGIGEDISLEQFVKARGLSMKTLERKFKNVTGLSTKVYHDLVKFQQAVKKVRGKGEYVHGDLLEALGVGYYDQSHFVKACRKLTGQSPKTLFSRLPSDLTDFRFID